MGISNATSHVWASNAGEQGRPSGVSPVWIENIDAITPSGSGGSTYTGGEGIDVDNDNDIISLDAEAQDAINSYVNNSGSFLTDEDLNGYATESFVTNEIEQATSAFITSADLPDLDGYATETWVQNQGYITSIPSEYVTDTELATVSGEIVSQIPDTSDMATQTWVGQQGYLTSVPSEYVTDTEMSTYVAEETSAFVTSADIPEVPAVKDLIAGNGINISATSGDVTISADTSVLATQADLGPYATQTWTAQNYFPIDGLQVVSSSAEASGANIIYIVSGSNS